MNLAILINGLQMGGAERMASFLAGEWASAGHQVTLLTLDGPHTPYFPLDPRIRLIHLGVSGPSASLMAATRNFGRRLAAIRRLTRGQDVVIGFGGACLALSALATTGRSGKSIAYEQTDPLFTERAMGRIKRAVHRLALRLADAVVVQSAAAREALAPALWPRTHIIANPVRPVGAHATPAQPDADGRRRLVAVGRLDAVKGFDTLLHAWAGIQARLPDWQLVIYGEGVERPRLQRIIADEGLQERAFLAGATDQVESCLSRAHLFVLASRTEGFPNALCEAMAVGLPVVATDCRCGPADIVTPGRDGLLVPVDDCQAMGQAILSLASDPQRLAAMGQAASEVAQRFAKPVVMARWDALFAALSSPTGRSPRS